MSKPVYLDVVILEMSKIVMYDYWSDFATPKYRKKAKLCYMDTDSFIVHVKVEDICADLPGNIKKRFDISDFDVKRLLTMSKNIKVDRVDEV